jgi:hypothetical protein
VRARFACNLDCFPRVSLSFFSGFSFETAFFIPHYLIAQLIPALRCCFLCYTLMYTVRSHQQIISQPRRFLCTFASLQTQSRNECSSKTICTTARESHCSPITKTRQDQNIHHHSTQKREPLPKSRHRTHAIIRQQTNTISSHPTLYLYFEPNPRISTIICITSRPFLRL